MKILHIVPHVGAEASGPTYSCVRLAQSTAEQGHDVTLMSVDDGPVVPTTNFRHRVYPGGFPRLNKRSPQLWHAMREQARDAQIVHSHSLWEMPTIYGGWLPDDPARSLVISPRGTLHEWAWNHARWKKRVYWAVLQGATMRRAACLHATSEAEYHAIRERGLQHPVAVIPNGIDVLPGDTDALSGPPHASAGDANEGPGECRRRILLFLGRLHPIKGVPTLLTAWSRLHAKHPAWELAIVGPGSAGYVQELRRLAGALSLQRVRFEGPLYGRDKERMFRRAELYVLPTHSENFGMTIAEALAAGTPAIVTQGAPWAGLETERAGWWIEHGPDPLTQCLDHALALSPDALATMGRAGREWMGRAFRWEAIAADMARTYRWLGGEAARPAFVHLD